jgi:hypothetical protein
VIDKELDEWRFRVHKLDEENEALVGRDAHLREECATTMRHLVTDALQFDRENINYPKIGKEDVSIIQSFYKKNNKFLSLYAGSCSSSRKNECLCRRRSRITK